MKLKLNFIKFRFWYKKIKFIKGFHKNLLGVYVGHWLRINVLRNCLRYNLTINLKGYLFFYLKTIINDSYFLKRKLNNFWGLFNLNIFLFKLNLTINFNSFFETYKKIELITKLNSFLNINLNNLKIKELL